MASSVPEVNGKAKATPLSTDSAASHKQSGKVILKGTEHSKFFQRNVESGIWNVSLRRRIRRHGETTRKLTRRRDHDKKEVHNDGSLSLPLSLLSTSSLHQPTLLQAPKRIMNQFVQRLANWLANVSFIGTSRGRLLETFRSSWCIHSFSLRSIAI
jgi:hypothetical protein